MLIIVIGILMMGYDSEFTEIGAQNFETELCKMIQEVEPNKKEE